MSSEFDVKKYPDEIKAFLNEIYDTYGQFSAWKLRDMTHQEKPWTEAYENPTNNVISHESMQNYFKKMLVNKR